MTALTTHTLAAMGVARLREASKPFRQHYATTTAQPEPELEFVLAELNRVWNARQKQPGRRPAADPATLEAKFIADMETKYGKDLVDYALMLAIYKGFADGDGLARAEDIREVPAKAGLAPRPIKQERLTSAEVPPFLRGRTFGALGKYGYSPDIDLLGVATVVNEALGGTPPANTQVVNIEPASFGKPGFKEALKAQFERLTAHPQKAPLLGLEVTERGRCTPAELEWLRTQRTTYGFVVGYDDLTGTPQNYEDIAILQPDYVKLDGPFVQRSSEADLRKVIETVAANAPSAQICAEWTETVEAYKKMAFLGVDSVQSFVLNDLLGREPKVSDFSVADIQKVTQSRQALATLRNTAAARA